MEAKLPPHSLRAEQYVLGALLIDARAWVDVASLLREDDFYREDHRLIFRAISTLTDANQPCDVVTVPEWLRSHGMLEKAGAGHVGQLAADTTGAANIVAYAEIVRDKAILRGMIRAGHQIAETGFAEDGAPVADKLDAAERDIGAIRGSRDSGELISGRDAASRMVSRMEHAMETDAEFTGLATGMVDLDRITGGLQDSDLIYLAARPGMGKTSLALQLAYNVAIRGEHVAFFSLEMPVEQLTRRAAAVYSGVPLERLTHPKKLDNDEWPKLTAGIAQIGEAAITFSDVPGMGVRDIRAKARQADRRQKLRMVVVDFLQLIPGDDKQNRNNQIENISRTLKQMARELKCPVVCLSQLNRDLERRNNRRPMLSDLRDSGSIEQDADLVISLYQDAVYHEDSPHEGIAEVALIKHRNGATGTVEMVWDAERVRFLPYSGPPRAEREPENTKGQSAFSAQYARRVK